MTGLVYLLCAATCLLCAVMLLRGYRRSSVRLLFWAGLCFVGLMIENVMLYFDVIVFGEKIDLAVWRKVPSIVAVSLLVFGLVWESK
jgi:hypothetical protein